MAEAKIYDKSYKEQVVKLAVKVGNKKVRDELGVPYIIIRMDITI